MSVFPVGSLLVIWILLYAREGPTCESAIVSRVAFDLRRRCLPKRPLRRAAWGFLNRAISRVPPSECQGNSFRGLPVSNKDRRGVHQKLEATVRSGVAVPKDIKLFGRTDVYQWIKPYQSVEDTNTLERLHAERSETPSLEPPLGLLGVKSFFLPFDLVLQRTGFEPYLHAYLEAIRAEQLRQEQDRAEESRLRRFGYREGIFVDNRERRPPEDLELNLLREAEGVDGDALALEVVRQLERFRQEQKEQLNKNREEPRGGGLVVVCYLPGVSAADIKVQLALPGRHIVREEPKADGSDAEEIQESEAAFRATHRHRDEDFELDECFLLREKVDSAEKRLMKGAVLHVPPPLLPSLIISAPKSVRVLKWEAETFRGRYKYGRESEFLRFQRAFRLSWPAAWRLSECRLTDGRLVVVVPPLPKDAPVPDLFEEAKAFPLHLPVQERAAPHPPFRGFHVRNERWDWHFNFHRFPKIYDQKVDFFAMRDSLDPPPPSTPPLRKPKVRVVTRKNWMHA